MHVTPAGGNVFRDLGFAPDEAENLLIRADLMHAVEQRIAGMSQVHAAKLLGVSQPRVSSLTRGKITHFTIDSLVNMLARAGVRVHVTTRVRPLLKES
jgi:predicted XRE-type DNA-binding protein